MGFITVMTVFSVEGDNVLLSQTEQYCLIMVVSARMIKCIIENFISSLHLIDFLHVEMAQD